MIMEMDGKMAEAIGEKYVFDTAPLFKSHHLPIILYAAYQADMQQMCSNMLQMLQQFFSNDFFRVPTSN